MGLHLVNHDLKMEDRPMEADLSGLTRLVSISSFKSAINCWAVHSRSILTPWPAHKESRPACFAARRHGASAA